jgi:hypothetical protein
MRLVDASVYRFRLYKLNFPVFELIRHFFDSFMSIYVRVIHEC